MTNELDLVKGVEFLHAVETVKAVLCGELPTASEAYDAVMDEYESALAVLYPLTDGSFDLDIAR